MSIINFVKAMLPRVKKLDVEEDIRETLKELANITIPRFKSSGEHLRVVKMTDETNLSMERQFYSDMQNKYKGPNMIYDAAQAMDRMYINLQHISKIVDNVLEADILNEGLTIKKAHVVRAISCMSFVSSFGLDFLDYVLLRESIKRGAEEVIDPHREKHLDGRYRRFFQYLNDYSLEPEKFKKVMIELPDIVITDRNASSLSSVFDAAKIDPFPSTGLSGFTGNPIYHIGLVISSWQGARYNANSDKKRMLELRLLQLQELDAGDSNPAIEKEIAYLEKRIAKIETNMREVEEDLDIKR